MNTVAEQDESVTMLDTHVREMVDWHFSPKTGSLFWLNWAEKHFDPRQEVKSFDDLVRKFPHFQAEWLRDLQPDIWVPAEYRGRPYRIFETGGALGMPMQRICWEDHESDYEAFGEAIREEHFPRGLAWLMVGPTGPHRWRLAIEHLANLRASPCYFVDFDPRWAQKLAASGQSAQAEAYTDHVVEEAAVLLKHRKIAGLCTTPKLLQALAERLDLHHFGIRGLICGGAPLTSDSARLIVENILEDRIGFYPTYGNMLVGVAAGAPLLPEDNFSITYYAPQPRAVLRVVRPDQPDELAGYEEWGRVEQTALTREFFMPRFLADDEAIRRLPRAHRAWDGVGEVRPFGGKNESSVRNAR